MSFIKSCKKKFMQELVSGRKSEIDNSKALLMKTYLSDERINLSSIFDKVPNDLTVSVAVKALAEKFNGYKCTEVDFIKAISIDFNSGYFNLDKAVEYTQGISNEELESIIKKDVEAFMSNVFTYDPIKFSGMGGRLE